MKKLLCLVILALCSNVFALSPSALAADPIAWRRDSTGIYPNVTPPLHWQQVSRDVEALRFQAAPPDGDKPSGSPMPDGVIREWLLLGPLPAKDDPLNVPDQSALSPRAGDKAAGDAQWKLFSADSAYIDLARQFDTYSGKTGLAAYALTYLYSPVDAQFLLNINHTETVGIWLNGKSIAKPTDKDLSYGPPAITLKKGWNRLLVRTLPSTSDRPKAGNWYLNITLRSLAKSPEFDSKNLQWKLLLPAGEGFGAPTVIGGKIFLQSEPADLVCIDQATGRILWIRSNNYDALATDEEKKANPDVFKEIPNLQAALKAQNDSFVAGTPPKLESVEGAEGFKIKAATEKKLYSLMTQVDDKKYLRPKGQDVGYSGFTPVTDGKHVWCWFATGVTCCYDLDGKLVWRRLDNEGSFWEHGYSSSPLLADGKVIVFMNKLIAFDAKTGERLWTTAPPQIIYHGTPVATNIAGTPVCVLPTGHIVRLSDGKMIRSKGSDVSQGDIPSPAVIGNTVYRLNGSLHKLTLPAQFADPLNPAVQSVKLDVSNYPYYYLDTFLSSPLIHDGLAYCMNNSGVLIVVDINTMKIVYEKLLDLDHFQNTHDAAGRGVAISPSLAGNNIYLVGSSGTTLVIKPGRTYEQLAKNKIESVLYRHWGNRLERFVATPAFDGKQIFIRGERYLYCIGE